MLDLFCGIGNFTLAFARRALCATGVDLSVSLIHRARDNARRNGIHNAEFYGADLAMEPHASSWSQSPWDHLFLDPPRSGALRVIDALRAPYPSKVLYVSCNPATLARDAGALVRQHGFALARCGIVDMFPHTSHVETIALFVRA